MVGAHSHPYACGSEPREGLSDSRSGTKQDERTRSKKFKLPIVKSWKIWVAAMCWWGGVGRGEGCTPFTISRSGEAPRDREPDLRGKPQADDPRTGFETNRVISMEPWGRFGSV